MVQNELNRFEYSYLYFTIHKVTLLWRMFSKFNLTYRLNNRGKHNSDKKNLELTSTHIVQKYSETFTNGHLCKTDTSLLWTLYLSPFIFHYILCLEYSCYNGHLSNAYNGQLICAQEALIRLYANSLYVLIQ